ncbi:hypothetical protein [Methylophilus aquaticus]|uniref:Uncharacterized protein n=1 Tax=Methylophilus aquaticus TaxID=1971610 RepID=A0ABT9JSA8_9PROT|nr:hypothetical protein [Methylophilus aquaticus]MDP8567442.1 hypothetical protein [Methylophilus aquaticus]
MRMGLRACYADTKRKQAILDHHHDAGTGGIIHPAVEIRNK